MKLKAFTLTETLVAMLISSLAIGFGYMAYEMISRHTLSHKSIGGELSQASLFSNVFDNDLFYADSIQFENNRLSLFQNNSQNTNYRLLSGNVIRENDAAIDTFHLNAEKIDTNSLAGTDIIGQIVFSYQWEGEKRKLVFNKQYGAGRSLSFDTTYFDH